MENIDDTTRPLSAPGRIENSNDTPTNDTSYTTSGNTSVGPIGCHAENGGGMGEDYFST